MLLIDKYVSYTFKLEKLNYNMYVGLSSKQNSIIGGNVDLQTGHFTESTAWE